jgi:hypothetical protein
MIGGDPLLHSQFDKLIDIFMDKVPRERRGLWTSDFRGRETELRKIFSYVNYNPHTEKVLHTPDLCASKDIIKDPVERRKYIDNCWLAEKWSPSITPKGVYRCEVMGAMDLALNYDLGLPLSLNWWVRPMEHFEKQIETFCNLCGVCLPLEAREDKEETDDVTKSAGKFCAIKKRPYILHDPKDIKFTDDKEPYRYIDRMKTKE